MKHFTKIGAFVIGLTALFILAANTEDSGDEFKKLHMLIGTWKMDTKKGPLYESWRMINSTELKSKSYKLNGNDTILLERVQLVQKEKGIFYIPLVEGQNDGQPVAFKLISTVDNRYTFENKTHDYPQRIIYNLIKADSIVARIEGEKNGKLGGSNYYFKKVN